MKAIPPIKAVMTTFPYWIEIDAPLSSAKEMMADHDIRHLPVVEGERLVSVLGYRELLHVLRADSRKTLKVRDACEKKVYVVGLFEPLDKVLRHMAEQHVESALVVKDDKLAGIFTTSDACLVFDKLLQSLFPGGDDNAA